MSDELTQRCDLCRKTIYEGELYGVMVFNLESQSRTAEYPKGVITVHDSVEVTTMCSECASKFDNENVRQLID